MKTLEEIKWELESIKVDKAWYAFEDGDWGNGTASAEEASRALANGECDHIVVINDNESPIAVAVVFAD